MAVHLLTHHKTDKGSSKCPVGNGGRLWNHMAGCTGKRGRAIELGTNSMTQKYNTEEQKGHSENMDTLSCKMTTNSQSNVVDLFSIGASKEKEETKETKPFIHQIRVHGLQYFTLPPVLFCPPADLSRSEQTAQI